MVASGYIFVSVHPTYEQKLLQIDPNPNYRCTEHGTYAGLVLVVVHVFLKLKRLHKFKLRD